MVLLRTSESMGPFCTMSFVIFVKYSMPLKEDTKGLEMFTVSMIIVPVKFFTSLLLISSNFPVLSNALGQTFAFKYSLNMLSGTSFNVDVSPGLGFSSEGLTVLLEQDCNTSIAMIKAAIKYWSSAICLSFILNISNIFLRFIKDFAE